MLKLLCARLYRILILLSMLLPLAVQAAGPADNNPLSVRAVPPAGIEIAPEVRQELLARIEAVRQQLAELDLSDQAQGLVEVFPRAVRMTLDTNMFYSAGDVQSAHQILDEAERRIQCFSQTPNLAHVLGLSNESTDAPQLIVGGFRSRIDDSIQPYGLEVPANFGTEQFSSARQQPLRLDVWLHGRSEKVSEVGFLKQRMTQFGQYAPANTIVLHPYGRYSNAFKFAGEVDVLEAIEHVQSLFPVDTSRITIRGFSMGGAGCWQLAAHYPGLWAAANPGAGFSETTKFLRVFQDEVFVPTAFQAELLHWYDCPDWTNNFRNFPTIAYSGEIDRQKQAADVMEAAFAAANMKLTHIIGPQTAHKIHPDSKREIERRLTQALAVGKPVVPKKLDLTTYSLRYNTLGWLTITGLQQHWQAARVQGELGADVARLTTSGVTDLELQFGNSDTLASPLPNAAMIDGQAPIPLDVGQAHAATTSDEIRFSFHRTTDGHWVAGKRDPQGLAKRPGLQGPIDDCFMDAFVFVAPDKTSENNAISDTPVDRWVAAELEHATAQWQRQMRGDIRVLQPSQVTAETIATCNLVLFGTPQSNSLMAKLSGQLPLTWDAEALAVGGQTYDAQTTVPVMVYPNPLNPDRYVVLNSGFTYREYAYLNNARQIPMLPDWAVVDITDGATTVLPGKIQAAGFFDETWAFRL